MKIYTGYLMQRLTTEEIEQEGGYLLHDLGGLVIIVAAYLWWLCS